MAEASNHMTLGEYLVREGFISQSQFNQALEEQRATSRSIGRILVDSGLLTESMRMSILNKRFGFQIVSLQGTQVDPMVLAAVPYAFAEKHHVVPIRQESNRSLVVALEDPSDMLIVDAIKNQVGMPVTACVASQEDIQSVLSQYATGVEEAAKARAARRVANRPSLFYRIMKVVAFPVFALAPLAVFFIELFTNESFQSGVQDYILENKLGLWDLAVYFALVWGLWSIILFEINGLIFGEKPRDDEDE